MVMQKHNSIKRILRRCKEELQATKAIAKVETVGGALVTFISKMLIQAINRGWLKEGELVKKLLLRKHKVMQDFFDQSFADFLKNYDYNPSLPEIDRKYKNAIWLCWWQGEDNAPEITKKCIESIRRNSGGNPVIVIDETTYKEYVEIPDWLEKKYKAGIISRTHYSDILRLSLLSTYGGLWLDATMYCTAPVLNTYLKLPLWTMKRPGYGYLSIAGGRFATYCLGCDWEHRYVFRIIRDSLLQYWKVNDSLIDYLVFDYMIDLAIQYNTQIAECFNRIAPNNWDADRLMNVMGIPYDEAIWKNMSAETSLFKLSWKRSFPMEIDGVDTFYGMLMKEKL